MAENRRHTGRETSSRLGHIIVSNIKKNRPETAPEITLLRPVRTCTEGA